MIEKPCEAVRSIECRVVRGNECDAYQVLAQLPLISDPIQQTLLTLTHAGRAARPN